MSRRYSILSPCAAVSVCVFAVLWALAFAPESSNRVRACIGGGGGTGGGAGGGNTIGTGATSGVAVDADGVLRLRRTVDPTGELTELRLREAAASLDADVAQPSPLRKVSLTRLLAQIDRAVAEGHGPDDAMQHLAGLTRLKYVFYFPETKDVVLAGPAEGWVTTPDDRVVGWNSGQPVLELQDLIVALRTFGPEAKRNPFVYCSIDPTEEGLQRMQQFLSEVGRQIQPGDEQFIVENLQQSLGPQVISVGGVPANTHFAQVMVEADYRMKLIGIGLEDPPVRIASYVALASPAAVAANALQRWYFVPDYQRIKVSADSLAAEFIGSGVKLVGADEVVSASGGRQQTSRQSGASQRFTRGFTDKYGQLAERAPVYAQLRNCVDLLVAAALIQKQDYFQQAGVDLGAAGDESRYPVETYNAPREVASAVNSLWKGRKLMTPIGGGVEIRANLAVDANNMKSDDDGAVAAARGEIDVRSLPADRWWWD